MMTPNINQAESKYYSIYRRGVIQRHICRNGRFLQEVLLLEQDPSTAAPDEVFHTNRRHSLERLRDSEESYEYSAYPVVVHDEELRDRNVYPEMDYVVGGGDNPLLHGGLAMATFAIEDLLGVSENSWKYATLLFDYFLDSEVRDAAGHRMGWLMRRRQWWHKTKDISKDELCGLLLGLHFFVKAAKKRGDSYHRDRAVNLLLRMGQFLQERDYGPAGAYVFQFPFTRVFKFSSGTSNISGRAFPSDMGPFGIGDQLATAAMTLVGLFSGDFDITKYTARDLYRDTMEVMPEIFGGGEMLNMDTNFFNLAMYMHTLIMIFDNPVDEDIKDDFWNEAKGLFNYFGKIGPSPAQGYGTQNAYLGLVMHAYSRELGKESQIKADAKPMYNCIKHPKGVFSFDLPLCRLSANDGLPGSVPFVEGLWGENFTWEHTDNEGHTLQWSWAKTLREIGVTEDNRGLLKRNVVQGKYYNADLSRGFRVEASGMDFLFLRVLAAYFGLADVPSLDEDLEYSVLPIDGPPTGEGYLGNNNTKEVHSYLRYNKQCQIGEMNEEHKVWFKSLQLAEDEGYDPCAKCLKGSMR